MKRLKSVDAVIVGGGWSGLLMAKELVSRTALQVVVLERGPARVTADYAAGMDEVDYALRDFSGVPNTVVYDPITRVVGPNGIVTAQTSFPGNAIPANRVSPTSIAVLQKWFPLPNRGNLGDTHRTSLTTKDAVTTTIK